MSFNRTWRFFATALGFVIFGLMGLLFGLFLIPLAYNPHRKLARQLLARKMNATIWRIFIKYLCCFGVLSFCFSGAEKLGRKGQLILVNHPSLLDVLFIVSHASVVNCVVKKELLKNPVMLGPITSCGYIVNNDPLELIEQTEEVLKEQSLLIFPEGTRTGWDGVIKLNRGATSIGLRSAEVITPVVIKMRPANFKKGQAWYKIPKDKIHYEITVMEDIYPQDYLKGKPLPIAAREFNTYLQDLFQRNS